MSESRAYRLMPWAWAAAWALTGIGTSISDIYSWPGNGPFAYVICAAVGWGLASYVTASAVRSASPQAFLSCLIGWLVAYVVAVPLSLLVTVSVDLSGVAPVWALVIGAGIAGALGGLLTPPSARARPRTSWARAAGAICRSAGWGLCFLILATVSVYAFYLFAFALSPLRTPFAPLVIAVVYTLPAAVCGLVAGFIGRRLVGRTAVEQALAST